MCGLFHPGKQLAHAIHQAAAPAKRIVPAGKHAVFGAVPRRRQRLVHLAIDEFDVRLPIAGLLDHGERGRRRIALPNLAYQPAFLQLVAFFELGNELHRGPPEGTGLAQHAAEAIWPVHTGI